MSKPRTGSIEKVIEACEIVEAELKFHADRLARNVDPANPSEDEHLADVRQGYRNAARYVGILRHYQEGRVNARG